MGRFEESANGGFREEHDRSPVTSSNATMAQDADPDVPTGSKGIRGISLASVLLVVASLGHISNFLDF